MDIQTLITAFLTLFVIIDPIGLAPLFVALTPGASAAHRRAVGLRAVTIAFVILTVFGLFGDHVLTFVGISMPAFRIAGGLLLFLTALEMLFEKRSKRREEHAQHPEHQPVEDPSVFPLATPLLAGPGAITSMILLIDQSEGVSGVFFVLGVLLAVLLVVLFFFMMSTAMERILGATGINVVTRLMGMLLAALSVQFVIDGLKAVFF
ncbi:MAG: MarC family protein [Alphaproteobacteria bacterium]|jgi:multiple antibiotic resistance protein|nr:MarC family protein [Alphaproteobacteria bacterium]MBU1281090.1 MarC family protein [Alphaproteobacteria bacterium]MBU1571761.1 MarC family protein [Alphaproteobacteria bacterium]MBU1828308.1 MarC family protein [Alphaproteobacteria bacterium]MBU2078510.1 MarC family protein [Alphaproteobacteria bacterium]